MNERLDRITPEMDEAQVLSLLLEAIINRAEPEVAEAIRLSAIPHWFNQEFLARLGDDERQTQEILSKLTQLTFVSPYHDWGYAYHKNVRNLLLLHWRQEYAERFQELSGKTAAYYSDLLQLEKLPPAQRAEWEREKMYHLLAADENLGINLFISLCNRACDSFRLSTLHLLLGLADEQATSLSTGNRLWIKFFEGKINLLSGSWDDALRVWETLEQERELLPLELEKTVAVHLALLYKDKGEWGKAIECFQHCLNLLEQAGDERGLAVACNNLGFLYKDKEQWEDADRCFRRSLDIFKKMNDKRGMSSSLNNLGLLHKDKGEWESGQTVECFMHSLEILESAGDKSGIASTCSDLGFFYKDKRQWEEADKYFQRTLEILDTMDDKLGKASTFNSLGFLYTDKKEWTKADRYFQQALKILEKLGNKRRMADTFSYLGYLYGEKKEWKKADEYLRHGLRLLEDLDDERGIAAMLHNLGKLSKRKGDLGSSYQQRREWEKAANYFKRSLEIVVKVGDAMNAATTMYHIALLYEDMQQYEEAVELLEKIVKIYEQVGHPDVRIRSSRELLEKVKKKQAHAQE